MIMQELKARTRPHHDRLEQLSHVGRIMDGSLTRADYEQLIRNNYRVHAPLEARLAAALAADPIDGLDFEARRKTPALRQDMQVLGLDTDDRAAEALLPEITDHYQALGALYVLEGATLGGSVIRKALARNPHLQDAQPFHYYGVYGEQTGPRWKQFGRLANERVQTPEHAERAIQAAIGTFEAFAASLTETIPTV